MSKSSAFGNLIFKTGTEQHTRQCLWQILPVRPGSWQGPGVPLLDHLETPEGTTVLHHQLQEGCAVLGQKHTGRETHREVGDGLDGLFFSLDELIVL